MGSRPWPKSGRRTLPWAATRRLSPSLQARPTAIANAASPREWTITSPSRSPSKVCGACSARLKMVPTVARMLYPNVVRRAWIVLVLLAARARAAPTFYRDVLPILQSRCQECHRPGQLAPMPFVTYRQTRPWAKAIREAVRSRKMPPWFADACCGKFANDRSLTAAEIGTLAAWAESGAAEGKEGEAPPPRRWPADGNLASPDRIVGMPQAFDVPARGA